MLCRPNPRLERGGWCVVFLTRQGQIRHLASHFAVERTAHNCVAIRASSPGTGPPVLAGDGGPLPLVVHRRRGLREAATNSHISISLFFLLSKKNPSHWRLGSADRRPHCRCTGMPAQAGRSPGGARGGHRQRDQAIWMNTTSKDPCVWMDGGRKHEDLIPYRMPASLSPPNTTVIIYTFMTYQCD
jgi:hypothetical protein